MTTIAEKLLLLNSTKTNIKDAIESKGVTVGSIPFADYPSKIEEITTGGGATWVRPSDWLVLPTITETDQKFVGLHSIYPDANFLALTASGDYTVDWGDGTVQNFAAGVVAEKEYNYATYDTGNTTLSSRGYKQVIVTITMQSGQTLTELNLHRRHSSQSVSYRSGFLDIALSGPSLADLRIGSQTPDSSAQIINFNALERINIVKSDVRVTSFMLSNCRRLQSIVSLETSTKPAANLNVTFTDAGDIVNATGHGLRNGDSLILSSLTSTTGITVGTRYFVISATTNTFQISSSYRGTALPLNTDGSGIFSVGTDMTNMFSGSSSLQTVPAFNTASVTSMVSMFNGCSSLQSIPLFNTASVTSMVSMFQGCSSLQSIPLFNTASVTSMVSMFQGCVSLKVVPLLDTSGVTNASDMFNSCLSLQSVPLFNTSSVTTIIRMFSSCSSLQSIPALNFNAVTNTGGSAFNGCPSLSDVNVTNLKVSFSVANCKLSSDRLNEIYTNLPTVTGQTITVTGNYGTATDNPAIATAKGWTVTG